MPERDAIAEPWGTRTPYGGGESWPARTDQYLADGVDPGDVQRWVRTASLLHSNGDAMDIAVADGRIVGVRGRAEDRVNRGRLGPKDLFGWQANGSADRLTRPLIRRRGRLVETDWDTAMNRVVAESKRLLAKRGPSAIGFYTSGQLFCEEYYTLAAIGHGGIGTNHMDGNTRLCTATAAAALKETFACDGQPGSYTDVDHADVIALFGHNVAETQPVLWMRMLDRLAGPNPPRIVCVDPRDTPVARAARDSGGVHLAPLPGTNVALMNGLLHEIVTNGWVDRDYVDAHTVGFGELAERVAEYPPDRVAEICRVDPGGRPRRGPRPRSGAAAAVDRAAGLLPVPPGHRGGRAGQQPQPGARHARPARLRDPADERPAHRGEHPRMRRERGHGGFPQLVQRRPRHRPRPALEPRPAADPAHGAADACHADLPLRRAGQHPDAVGERHESGRVDARAGPDPQNPVPEAPVPRRAGHLLVRDRPARRRGPARGDLGREDRLLHQRRPHRAPVGQGRRSPRRGPPRPGHLPGLRPPDGFPRRRRAAVPAVARRRVRVRRLGRRPPPAGPATTPA